MEYVFGICKLITLTKQFSAQLTNFFLIGLTFFTEMHSTFLKATNILYKVYFLGRPIFFPFNFFRNNFSSYIRKISLNPEKVLPHSFLQFF